MTKEGTYEGWNWALIGDSLAIDNKAAVRAEKDEIDKKVVYQQVVVPLDLVCHVASEVMS